MKATMQLIAVMEGVAAAVPGVRLAAGADWRVALLTAIAVAVVSTIFQWVSSRRIKRLEAKLETRTGYYMPKLEAHEQLWPLVADCNRAQESLRSLKRQRSVDYGPAAQEISECRKKLKSYVYDHGLHFGDDVRELVRRLDRSLGDNTVDRVRDEVLALEQKLREIMDEWDY